MTFGKFVVWLIVGIIAGTLAGRVVTLSREGLGRWTNLGVGMLGAVIGGYLLGPIGIKFGLADLKISVEDLLSAFLGSMILIVAWWIFRFVRARKIRNLAKRNVV